ncbi:NACHT, LRR and PYD domains-containing protein 3-like [Latimeria chalumnae]|uniref:NACHT, LRR and PYD domains-containing protein 3-like n=1 Tax=Latimeria chalumnae TaxID=7897 RepID=UPI00313ED877
MGEGALGPASLDHPCEVENEIAALKQNQKKRLMEKFGHITEYTGKAISIDQHFTKLWITEGTDLLLSQEPDQSQMETGHNVYPFQYDVIFNPSHSQQKAPRTFATKGIAGIGKTICVQKLIVDWAAGSVQPDFDFVFVFSFRELNLLDRMCSLVELVAWFYPNMKFLDLILNSRKYQCLFIFDGLDEFFKPLAFERHPTCSDINNPLALEVIITNILQGNLLPFATIWVTSRPTALSQIPQCYLDQVTEIQGFQDAEKEEYIKKKCTDPELAQQIVSHVKKQRSLFTMCSIPAFCWILVTVFERVLRSNNALCTNSLPTTMTEIYTHFLIVMMTFAQQKLDYGKRHYEEISVQLKHHQDTVFNLGMLAFNCLQDQRLIFYKKDLDHYGLDIALIRDGFCKEILVEDLLISQVKAYSFIHLSVQEYFAALYVAASYSYQRLNLLNATMKDKIKGFLSPGFFQVFKKGYKEAVKSNSGHLDMFLRFLCGLCTEQNGKLLNGLLESKLEDSTKISSYIKAEIKGDISPQNCINLFHCLNELRDNSIVDEMKESLSSGVLTSQNLTPMEYSALAFVLQVSDSDMEEFDLSPYDISPYGLRRLQPGIKLFKKIKLADKSIRDDLIEAIGEVPAMPGSQVEELCLKNTDVQDSGVVVLSGMLKNPNCKLSKLILCRNDITEGCCKELASSLLHIPSLKKLDLSNNHFGEAGLALLCVALREPDFRLQNLKLEGNDLTSTCCVDLADALSSNQHLQKLNLSYNPLKDQGVNLLVSALGSPDAQLQVLKIKNTSLTKVCCEDIASCLQSNQSLRALDLSRNKLTDSGLELLLSGRMTASWKLKKLVLHDCRLSPVFGEVLADALRSGWCLQSLEVGHNNLGLGGIQKLCAVLRDHSTKLEILSLLLNNIPSEGCKDLAFALTENETLTGLHLGYNRLWDSGIKILSDALRNSRCKISILQLSYVGLSDVGLKDLLLALDRKETLVNLNLSLNQITDSSLEPLCHFLLNCTSLQRIKLCQTSFSTKGQRSLEEFGQSRPGLKIIFT